jgi:hypothetical protein
VSDGFVFLFVFLSLTLTIPTKKVGTLPPDDFRNQRFKLIPRIVDGPWVVKASIPQKPALLGQKLTQR